MSEIPDVLATRYASKELRDIWSEPSKIIAERRLWVAVLRAQKDAGLAVSEEALAAYEMVLDSVDLESIARREAVTRHDVKARIEEFNGLAKHELIHVGMTSRDATDNVEQMQIRQSLRHVRARSFALLRRLRDRAVEFADVPVCGRTHNVPAQATTLGKRFAMWAEEYLCAFSTLEHAIRYYPLRGLKGPVGTQQDMVALVDAEKTAEIEKKVGSSLEFSDTLTAVGQVYPRSLDFMVIAALAQLASAPANMAMTLRLMAGQGQVTEGFAKGQTGSSAMPHKMNMRTCERINGFLTVITGHLTMATGLLGNQWYEGDVSCSVVRRVCLPGAFFAIDGMLESSMTVLDEMGVFVPMIERELASELPFLSTTALLMEAVSRGRGREQMHALIKGHATTALTEIRSGGSPDSFARNLGEDPDFPLSTGEVEALIVPDTGLASEQVRVIVRRIDRLLATWPKAAAYNPAPIL